MTKPPPPTQMISAALVEVAALKLVLRVILDDLLPDEEVDRRNQIEAMIARIDHLAMLARSPGLDDAFGGRLTAEARRVATGFLADLKPRTSNDHG